MDRRIVAVFALLSSSLWALGTPAQAAPGVRYISDETAITLREDKGMNAPVAALLKSGSKVDLLEEDSASGYSRVRVAPGREGWVLARYLSTEPAAREKLAGVQSQLAEQQARVRKLETDNARLRESAAAGARSMPGTAVSAPVDEPDDHEPATDKPSEPVVMATGAGLFIAGLLAGLLIPLVLPRGKPRQRWSADL